MSDPWTDGYDLLALDPEYGKSCPCATVVLPQGTYRMHCWRTCFRCEHCGIHYRGDRATAERMKVALDAIDWYGEWTIAEGLWDA